MTDVDPGWRWFEEPHDPVNGAGRTEIAKSFTRCFAGAEGRRVLDHLRAMTTERVLGPDASDTALRHLEGQRHLVATIAGLIAQGETS